MSVHVPLSAFVFSSTGIDAFTLVCASVIPPLPLSVLHTFVDTDRYWVGCRGLTWFRSGGHTCEKDCILSHNCYSISIKRRKWKL